MTTDTTTPGTDADATTHFGARTVPISQKQDLVDDVFHRVANRYDLMNDLMSGGLHRTWKDAMVSWLAPPHHGRRPFHVLDVAGGTGDIAFRIAARAEGHAKIIVCDINESMLSVGRDRAAERGLSDQVQFVVGNAEAPPFDRRQFDAYTIAFGIRNVPRIPKALAEAHRVLRPGGRFLCLEFSHVDMAGLDTVYDLFSDHVIPRIGRIVAGDDQPYKYLVESIREFPAPARFAQMITDAGFERATWRPLSGGIAAIHSAYKI